MALANYTDLKAAIATWITRSDQTANIPDFITLYEADANRRIRIRQNSTSTPVTLTLGASTISLPSDFLEDIELNYNDTPMALTKASFDDLDRMQTADSAAGRPAFYAINGSTILFETEADATYTLNLRYYKKWNIAADTTNWLLTNAPDTYLFGSIAEGAMLFRDSELLQIGIQRRDAATDWVLKSDSRVKSRTLFVDRALSSIGV
jgi:hypothetical protein